jgi:hypothetical protein
MDRDDESPGEWEETESRLKSFYVWTRRAGWTWQAFGAVSGLGGGVLAAAVGALLSAVALVRGDESGGLSLHSVGSILLLSMIPLLVMGAHCLDLLDKRMERSRYASREGKARQPTLPARTRLQLQLTGGVDGGLNLRRFDNRLFSRRARIRARVRAFALRARDESRINHRLGRVGAAARLSGLRAAATGEVLR